MKLSVIIPTHNRPAILKQCLEHLARQTVAKDLEVIVVSDCNHQATEAVIKDVIFHFPFSIFHFVVPPTHQGVARNEGLKHAMGEYVMFIGDDIFLAPDACEKHLHVLRSPLPEAKASGASRSPGEGLGEGARAVLGFTTWDPSCGITPVMRWLEKSGWQFGYPKIAQYAHALLPQSIQHKFTYTSHISLPLDVAKKHLFRTDVSLYGWEDIEWGMRLHDAGVRLFYEPDAKAIHHHHIELEDSLKRMETLGRAAAEIKKNVPEFDRVPRGWKLLAYRLLALLPTMAGLHRHAFIKNCKRAA